MAPNDILAAAWVTPVSDHWMLALPSDDVMAMDHVPVMVFPFATESQAVSVDVPVPFASVDRVPVSVRSPLAVTEGSTWPLNLACVPVMARDPVTAPPLPFITVSVNGTTCPSSWAQ